MKTTYAALAASHSRAIRAYDRKQRRLKRQVQRLDDEIKRIEAKRNAAKYPHFIERCIEPIAEMMAPLLGAYTWEVMGPFGMLHRTSIHFYRKGVSKARRFSGRNCLSITFIPEEKGGGVKILDQTTGGPGARVDPHGFRHERVEIPPHADGQWFVDWMEKNERIARRQDAKERREREAAAA